MNTNREKKMNHLVYATSNPGKIQEMRRHLGGHGFIVESMEDLGFESFDVPETGTSLGENAVLKINAYLARIKEWGGFQGEKFLVLSDDTGFEVTGLNGEPGIHVRRWKDGVTRMEDEEIIEYAMELMKGLVGNERSAQFHAVLAIGVLHEDGTISEPKLFDGFLKGTVLEEPSLLRMEGFPMASLLFVDEWGMLLGEAEMRPWEEKKDYLSHRERAVDSALPFLKSHWNT